MARIGAKLCQNAFRTILNVSSFDAEKKQITEIFGSQFRFSLIWRGFGPSTFERTSKSASTSNFALDRLILRSVRPKNPEFGSNLGSPKIFTRLKVSVSLEELFPQPQIAHDDDDHSDDEDDNDDDGDDDEDYEVNDYDDDNGDN